MERAEGIEPSSSAWKAEDQPLAQARMKIANGAPGWSRTSYARVAAECLAVRPPMLGLKWSPREESNLRPAVYKTAALS